MIDFLLLVMIGACTGGIIYLLSCLKAEAKMDSLALVLSMILWPVVIYHFVRLIVGWYLGIILSKLRRQKV